MCNCANCENSVYVEQWGDYKCMYFEHRIYVLLDSSECPKYEKKKEKP